MKKHKKVFVILAMAIVITGLSLFVYMRYYHIIDVSIQKIAKDPESYDGAHVRLRGYVVEMSYTFGPKYVLKNKATDKVEIPLDERAKTVDLLEPYVSFVWHPRYDNYTKIRDMKVIVIGYLHYRGPVIDAPSYYLEVETVMAEADEA